LTATCSIIPGGNTHTKPGGAQEQRPLSKRFYVPVTKKEFENWKSQFVISNSERMGLRKLPFAFTEQGVAMLSGVLNSAVAIKVHIQIIRVFGKMKELLLTHKDILLQLEKLEKKFESHDEQIQLIFNHLKELLNPQQPPRNKIGFKRDSEN
jgi:hypothetical protein